MIQENAKIFKKKLYVLKKKQHFTVFSDDNSSDLLIFEINTNTVFFALSDDFWTIFNIEENFSASAEFFQNVQ